MEVRRLKMMMIRWVIDCVDISVPFICIFFLLLSILFLFTVSTTADFLSISADLSRFGEMSFLKLGAHGQGHGSDVGSKERRWVAGLLLV